MKTFVIKPDKPLLGDISDKKSFDNETISHTGLSRVMKGDNTKYKRRVKIDKRIDNDNNNLNHDTKYKELGYIPLAILRIIEKNVLFCKSSLGDIIAVRINNQVDDIPIIETTDIMYRPVLPHLMHEYKNIVEECKCDIIILTGHGIQILKYGYLHDKKHEINEEGYDEYSYVHSNDPYTIFGISKHEFRAFPFLDIDILTSIKYFNTIGDVLNASLIMNKSPELKGFASLCDEYNVRERLCNRDVNITLYVPITSSIKHSDNELFFILHHIIIGSINGYHNYRTLNNDDIEISNNHINSNIRITHSMKCSNGIIYIIDSPITNYKNNSIKLDDVLPLNIRYDIIDINKICSRIRDVTLRLWQEELINMEFSVRTILDDAISTSRSYIEDLIIDIPKIIDNEVDTIEEEVSEYNHPRMISIKDTNEKYKSLSLSKYSKETIKYVSDKNKEFNKVCAIISRISNLRVELDALSYDIKSKFSELKHHIRDI